MHDLWSEPECYLVWRRAGSKVHEISSWPPCYDSEISLRHVADPKVVQPQSTAILWHWADSHTGSHRVLMNWVCTSCPVGARRSIPYKSLWITSGSLGHMYTEMHHWQKYQSALKGKKYSKRTQKPQCCIAANCLDSKAELPGWKLASSTHWASY